MSSVLKAMFNKPAQTAKTDSVSHTAANSETGETKAPKGIKLILSRASFIYIYIYIYLYLSHYYYY